MFDLRSDTVSRPTEAMRQAMAEAEVGDDVLRDDPTVARLEQRAAELTGKEAALFVPSGTMANQIAMLCHCRPGDEVIIGRGSHCAYHESGAAAAWAGVQFIEVGSGGLLSADDVAGAIKPRVYHLPRTRLVVVENTHNRAGGRVFPQNDVEAIVELAHAEGLAVHMDGARIWNAAVATAKPPCSLAAGVDTVSVCFSKGLGAPVGSALCGDAGSIEAALRFRKMLGGAMRQAGIVAAGALYALEHHRDRLARDHEAARELGRALGELEAVKVGPVETNMVVVDLPVPAERAVAAARARGVLLAAAAPARLRLVTHLDVSGAERFAEVVRAVVDALREALGDG